MSDQSNTVNTSDDKTSKLEVALWLAKFLILGEFLLFGFVLVVWVVADTIGSIKIGEQTIITISAQGAETAVGMLLPITTGNIGALIGYILGSNRLKTSKTGEVTVD